MEIVVFLMMPIIHLELVENIKKLYKSYNCDINNTDYITPHNPNNTWQRLLDLKKN